MMRLCYAIETWTDTYGVVQCIDACGLMRAYVTDQWHEVTCVACVAAIALQLV